jgi:acyl-CoA synthetase (AMP-forming)/AMP-acid ligase II
VTLADLLIEHPFGDDRALLCTIDAEITAGAARSAARATADRLAGAGVMPGQAVAVQLPNGPDIVTTMVGIWLAGAVFVPINARAPVSEVATVVESTRPRAVVRADDLEIRADAATFAPDSAFATFTSGTTGRPKAILHTHTAYLELLDRILGPLRGAGADAPPAKSPSPNLIPVSLTLNAGIYNVLFGLRAGSAIVIMDRFATTDFATLVARYQIRSTVLPPAAMTMLCDDPAVTDLAPLRYVRSITAALSPLGARRFRDKFGVTVLNGYGQAEMGEVIGWTAADAKAHPEKLGAVGRVHAGVAIKIVDPDGNEVGVDAVGELLARPPNVAAGYASGGDMGERIDAEGYMRTGDLARIDGDGFVWIEGRLGDVINRGGNKVFPDHVEEVLRLSPRVREVAVVGIPDERLGEVPVAFIVGDASDTELQQLCREHLVPYKVPVAFHRIDALPRSEIGKVLRRELVAYCAPTAGSP